MKKRKVSAFLLTAVMAVSLLSGCGKKTGVVYETLGISPDETVLTVDGNKISADYYAYILSDFVSYLEYQNQVEIDWTQTAEDGKTITEEVREQVQQQAIYCAVVENLAKKYDIKLTDEQKESVKTDMESVTNTAGLQKSTWERAVKSQYLESNLYEYFSSKDSEIYVPEEELLTDEVLDSYVTVEHILIFTVDQETGEALDDATAAEKAKLAKDLAAQLKASDKPAELFETLAEQYSEDDRETYPSYTLPKNESGDAFTDASLQLEEGEISDLIETDYGYHIIMRVSLDTATVCEQMRQESFAAFLDQAMEDASVDVKSVVDEMDIAALYNAVITKAQETSEGSEAAETGD